MKFEHAPSLAIGAALMAQTVTAIAAEQNADDAPSSAIAEVTVTGSRITVPGVEAPTPVTSISDAEIATRGVSNVADFLNQLPAFAPSLTPASTTLNSDDAGSNVADLRGLGGKRTLVLVNGQRHVPTDSSGVVDLNVIPQALISRVDTVTGGASAAWGSDAVAGVVNIILDREFTGFAVNSRYGSSQEQDGQDYFLSVKAGGDFAGDRGHVVVGADYEKNVGVGSLHDRNWSNELTQVASNPADTGPNDGIPALITADHATLLVGSRGGHAWSGASGFGAPAINDPAGLLNVKFGPGGTVSAFNPGVESGIFAIGGDGGDLTGAAALSAPVTRRNVMALIDYAITPNVSFTADASFAQTETRMPFVSAFSFISGGPMMIGIDNPFLPASVRANMLTLGVTSLPVWRSNEDLPPVVQANSSNVSQIVLGLSGDLAASWTWQLHYGFGKADANKDGYNVPIPGNYQKAADVIADPVTGAPVCQSVLNGTDPGCVPFNPFGVGAPSQAAFDYVSGSRFVSTVNEQEVATASLSGKLIELPMGPVYAALGVEHRRDSYSSEGDKLASTGQFGLINFTPLAGEVTAKEAFGEIEVPLLSGVRFAEELGLNGAVRYTDYSSFGGATTWKIGSRWKPMHTLTLRTSYSKDIRAPNVLELYSQGDSSFTTVSDPANGGAVAFAANSHGGNPNLLPEESKTFTAGFAYEPQWLTGLTIIADWYTIDLEGLVTSFSAQTLVNRCYATGDAEACSRITRNSAGTITSVDATLINAAAARAKGVDFEMSYSFDPQFVPGSLQLRTFGNYTYEKARSNDGIVYINRAGELGRQNTDFAGPKLRVTAGLDYAVDQFGAFLSARYVGGGVYDTTFTQEDIDRQDISARTYFDLAGRWNLDTGAGELQLYGGVNNLANTTPPRIGDSFPGSVATNAQYFDVVGRYFYLGLRFRN